MILAGYATAPLASDLSLPIASRIPVEDGFVEVRDELWARALVLDDSYRQVVLIAADLLLLDADLVAEVRRQVSAAVQIPASHIFVVPTGTMTAPQTAQLPGYPAPSEPHLAYVACQLASAAVYAARGRRPCAIGWARGAESVGTHGNDSVRGPSVLRLQREDGQTHLIVELPCLPNGIGRELSADYPGTLAETLTAWQPGVTALGLLGPAAGVRPPLTDPVELGERLAGLAWATALTAPADPDAALRLASTTVTVTFEPPAGDEAAARAAQAQQRLARSDEPTSRRAAEFELARAEQALAAAASGFRPTIEVDLAAIGVGQTVLVLTPFLLGAGAEPGLRRAAGGAALLVSGATGIRGVLSPADPATAALERWHTPLPLAAETVETVTATVAELVSRLGLA